MPQRIDVQKSLVMVCDQCSKEVVSNSEKDVSDWLIFQTQAEKKFLMYEEIGAFSRSETMNLPGRKPVCFCTKECALKFMGQKAELFLRGLYDLDNRNTKPLNV